MTGWFSIREALRELQRTMRPAEARQALASRIAAGVITARALRLKETILHFEGEDVARSKAGLESSPSLKHFHPIWYGKGSFGEVKEYAEIRPYFFRQFLASDGEWVVIGNDPKVKTEVFANWLTGEFETVNFTEIESLDENDRMATFCLYSRYEYYGLEVERHMFDGLLAPLEPSGGEAHDGSDLRTTQYDWEAAFADVVSNFYWGEPFEDVNARGTATRIVAMLVDSFERRGSKVPGESILKDKAKKLLGAIRSGKGRLA